MVINKYVNRKLKEVSAHEFLKEVFPSKSLRGFREIIDGYGYGLVKISADNGISFRGRAKIIGSDSAPLKILNSNSYWCDFRGYTSPHNPQILDYRALVVNLNYNENTDEKRKEAFSLINNKGKNYAKPTYVLVCGDEIRLMYLFENRVSQYDGFSAFLFELYISLCDFFGTTPEGFDALYPLPASAINGNVCHAYRFGKKVKITELAQMVGIEAPKIKSRANKGEHHLFANVYHGWVRKMSEPSYVFTKGSAEVLREIGQRADGVTEDRVREDIRALAAGSSAGDYGDSGSAISFGTRKYKHASYGELEKLAGIAFSRPDHKKRANHKQEVLDWMTSHPGAKQRQCAEELGVPEATVCRILKAVKNATANSV